MDLQELRLRDFRPVPRLVAQCHEVERARFRAVDAHNHLGRWLSDWDGRPGEWMTPDVPSLLELMRDCNVAGMVNLDGRFGEELEANLDRYDRAHPGTFATFCHVDWGLATEPGFGRRLATSLHESVRAGAKGLKVWKDLGLHVRDERGELVLCDDARLAPLWEAAAELGVPVFIHTADPVAFFDPPDERNERMEELAAHPEWSFADPSFPRFERLLGALESLVASHPETTFVGLHFGCYAESPGFVARMLETYPNYHVDIAARLAELGRQPRAVRRLILSHPDRVLFGSDVFPPTRADYAIHFRFLETEDEHFPYSTEDPPPTGRWAISGLGLPDDVLEQVYFENAARLVPSLAQQAS